MSEVLENLSEGDSFKVKEISTKKGKFDKKNDPDELNFTGIHKIVDIDYVEKDFFEKISSNFKNTQANMKIQTQANNYDFFIFVGSKYTPALNIQTGNAAYITNIEE